MKDEWKMREWKMSERCVKDEWKMRERCVKDAWKMCERCVKDAWKYLRKGVVAIVFNCDDEWLIEIEEEEEMGEDIVSQLIDLIKKIKIINK